MENNSRDFEFDFSIISQKLKKTSGSASRIVHSAINQVKRNILLYILVLVAGLALGYLLQGRQTKYYSEVIVMPNFGSVNYLYSKIELLDSKIKERDTIFLKKAGLQSSGILEVEIKPINDIYEFVNNRERNFELLKLMAEDGDINKVIEDRNTSKNYTNHIITYKTNGKTTTAASLQPLLKYLNNSEYFNAVRKVYVQNLQQNLQTNDSIIKQIDRILDSQPRKGEQASSKGGGFVYLNENIQLNELIKTKYELLDEIGTLRLAMVNYTNIIKDNTTSLNTFESNFWSGNLKYIVALTVFIGFLFIHTIFLKLINKK